MAVDIVTASVETPKPEVSKWKVVDFVDSFGDKTGENANVLLITDGTFSNSATEDSKLYVKLTESTKDKYINIDLYEYGSTPGACLSYSGAFGAISYKASDGSIKKLKGFASKECGIFFSENDYTSFKKVLSENKEIKCRINTSDFEDNGSSYNFTIVQ